MFSAILSYRLQGLFIDLYNIDLCRQGDTFYQASGACACTPTNTRAHTHTHVLTDMQTDKQKCARMRTYTDTHVHTYMHLSTRTCAYTHIHAHTHTHAQLVPVLVPELLSIIVSGTYGVGMQHRALSILRGLLVQLGVLTGSYQRQVCVCVWVCVCFV